MEEDLDDFEDWSNQNGMKFMENVKGRRLERA